jgi:hypothetical protein
MPRKCSAIPRSAGSHNSAPWGNIHPLTPATVWAQHGPMHEPRLAVGSLVAALVLSISSMPVSAASVTVADDRDDVQRERYNKTKGTFVVLPGIVTPTPPIDIISMRVDYTREGRLVVNLRFVDIGPSFGLAAAGLDVDGDGKNDMVLGASSGGASVIAFGPDGSQTRLCAGTASIDSQANRVVMSAPADCLGSPAKLRVDAIATTKRFKAPGVFRKRWSHDSVKSTIMNARTVPTQR